MQNHRGSRFLGADRRRWRTLILTCLAAAWCPMITHAEDADWLWQNPRPVGAGCRTGWSDQGGISFLDSQTGMAVGCGGKILRTDDGGLTWTDSAGDLEGNRLSLRGVSVIDSDTATVVGTYTTGPGLQHEDFVARTEDGGATWARQATGVEPPTNVGLSDVYFSDAASGLAVGFAHLQLEQPDAVGQPVIVRTTNGGDTWTSATDLTAPPLIFLYGLACVDPVNCVAVGYGADQLGHETWGVLVLRTTDGGETWDTSLYDTETQQNFEDVACAGAGTCIAVGRGGIIFGSTDGGSNWTRQVSGTEEGLSSVSCVDGLNCVVAGGTASGVILRTEDGGNTWVQELDGNPTVLHGISFHGNTENATAISDRLGGFLQTADGGATWSRHPQFQDYQGNEGEYLLGGHLRAIAMATSTSGVAVGETTEPGSIGRRIVGALLRTVDGGNTWTNLTLSLPIYPPPFLFDVDFADSDTGIAVGRIAHVDRAAVILRSSDGGASWSDLTGTIPPEYQDYELSAVHFLDGDVGTVVGGGSESGVILHTIDGGSTWSDWTPSEASGFFTGVFFSDSGTGTVVGHGGRILQTTDGAATWEDQPSGTDADLRAVVFTDESSGWVVGENTVLHTVDGGATWTDATPEALLEAAQRFDLTDVAFSDAENGMMVGGLIPEDVVDDGGDDGYFHGVVLTTTDAGATWEVEDGKVSRVEKHYGVAPLGDGDWMSVGGVPEYLGTGFILRKSAAPTFRPLAPYPVMEAVCVPEGAPEEVPVYAYVGTVGGYTGTVQLSSSGEPSGVTSELEPGSVDPPGRSTWTLTVDGSVSPGQHVITLTGDDGEEQHFANFTLNVVGPDQAPVPLGPADGATDVDLQPTLTWAAIPGVDQYRIQIATDPTFSDIVIDEEAIGVSFMPATELDSLTLYFWRVQGVYECLDDVWSEAFSFTTETKPQVQVSPSALAFEVPLGSGDDSTVEIANIGTGDLVWGIDVELLPADGCAEAQWLTVSPDAGSTPADGSTPVIVTADTAGLEVCDYTARLHVATNDTDHASVTVPVSLTVTGSELVFDPQGVDFGEVEAGHVSPPEVVTLHSVGVLDASGVEFQLLGDDFTVDTSACGATLPIGGQCEVVVTFAPPGVGPSSAALEVHSDDGAFASVSLSGQGVSETEIFTPMGLEVDTEPIISDANSVFEPGELARVAPIWRNDGLFAQFLEGTASNITGPEGPTYSLVAADADYGEVETGETVSCEESGLCYEMDIGPVGVPRPASHWDASFDEALSDETTHAWTLHLGDSFDDVPRDNLFYRSVETLLHSGVTGGCTGSKYCPAASNSRAQMAVFLLRAVEGGDYTPPTCVADEEEFFDVPAGNTFCPWIEELAARGVTTGCGGGNYCPADSVTRAQMAVFLLKAAEGDDYVPPPCTGAFSDVLCPSTFAAWIEDLAARGITGGCSETEYCPATPVTRAQMASFLTRAFGLELYGP